MYRIDTLYDKMRWQSIRKQSKIYSQESWTPSGQSCALRTTTI